MPTHSAHDDQAPQAAGGPAKPAGGQAPFGYRWQEGRLTPDPQEAPVRRLLHELFLAYRCKKTVARILNERGHRTRKGAAFSGTTVDRLLRDPTAKGVSRASAAPVEPIVPAELWDRCHAILAEQAQSGSVTRKPVHLFAGLTECTCGSPMAVPSNSPKYVCPYCRNKIPAADLEAVFSAQLEQVTLSREEIMAAQETADSTNRGPDTGACEPLSLASFWPDLTLEEKRRVVENLTERVVVGTEELTLELCALSL